MNKNIQLRNIDSNTLYNLSHFLELCDSNIRPIFEYSKLYVHVSLKCTKHFVQYVFLSL